MNNKSYMVVMKHVSFLFLIFFLCLAETPALVLPQFWTQEIQFSLGEAKSIQPDVCARKEEIFVVWADNRISGNFELFYRYSSDGGLTWSIEERITKTETDSTQPAIVCGRSNVHLVWREKEKIPSSPESSTILYSQWNGKSWSAPQSLSLTPQNNPRRPDIAITQTGVVYVVWEEDSSDGGTKAYFSMGKFQKASRKEPVAPPPETRIAGQYATRNQPRGAGGTPQAVSNLSGNQMVFQKPKPITVGDWNTAEPSIAGGYRTAYVVWRDEREATAQIYTKQLNGTLLGYDTRLSSSGNCRRPSISVLEPQIYVAYESRSTEFFPADIFVAESDDNGQSWEQIHQISSSTAESIRPVISATSDMVWLFWQDGESGNWKIHFSYKKDLLWSPSEWFKDSGKGTSPTIARSSGYQNPQFYLFWVEVLSSVAQASRLDFERIFYSRRDTVPPAAPGKPLHIDEDAKVGYDNDDALTFSWTQERKTDEEVVGYNIYASTNGGDFEKIDSTNRTVYDFTGENGKYYQIRVEAFDSVGNTSELSPPSEVIYVDNVPPHVQIHFPRSGSALVRPVPIIASCYDENLVSCRLKYGATAAPTVWQDIGEPIRTEIDSERILVWDTSGLQGVYTLNLSAKDFAGNHSSSKIPVIVDNLPSLPISPGEITALPNLDPDAAYRAPSFSFDGESICFSSNQGGTEDIWTYSISSRKQVRITQDQYIDFFPTWSPDSNWIAFQSSRRASAWWAGRHLRHTPQSKGWDIWITEVASSDATNGTQRLPLVQLESNETTPVFSPSGEQMAFTSDLDGDEEIFILTNVMEVIEGADPQFFQLTHNDYSDTSPAWAPDETRLAFCANRFGNWDLFEMYIDGSEELRLTDQLANETTPKYSPDGKRILYLSDSSGTYNSVVALSLVGDKELVKLTMPGEDVLYADWAKDSKSIVYQVKDSIQFRKIDFPVEHLKAVIIRPYEGENLRGEFFDIKGIASGANFVKYILEYSKVEGNLYGYPIAEQASRLKEKTPNSWRPIGGYSTVPVEYEDFLGRLDTSDLQGEYIIRLTVRGENSLDSDEVRVFVQREHPNLSIKKPLDGTISTADMISVEGEANPFSTVTVDGTVVELDEKGGFSTGVLLNQGVNKIQIKALNPAGLESQVERKVIRDTQKPEINLVSPADFALLKTPYVTISGQISEFALLTILNATSSYAQQSPPALQIPIDHDRRFSYTISLNEGTNEIRLKAKDQAGWESEILRRVIYEKVQKVTEDSNPPAITNVFPLNGITLEKRKIKVRAELVDDIGVDIKTLVFSFDDEQYIFDPEYEEAEEFDGEIFSFDSTTGEFSYVPEFELADGEHNFTIDVMDEEENSADGVDITFFIDTRPTSVALSASKDNNILKVTLTSNKPLDKILKATVYPTTKEQLISEIGYSLNLNLVQEGSDEKPFLYSGNFYPVPTYKGFILSSSVLPTSEIYGKTREKSLQTTGFYTDGEFSDKLELSIPDGPAVSLAIVEDVEDIPFPVPKLESPVHIVLRSQDGSDLDRVAAQLKDAKDRNLKLNKPVYQLESSRELDVPVQLKLELPNLPKSPHTAMFYWNERLRRWEPLDATVNAQNSQFNIRLKHDPLIKKNEVKQAALPARAELQRGILPNAFSAYVLLIDEQPPVIERIFPPDGENVPLDRFLVEIYFHDQGSGIARANLEVDGKQEDFILNREENRLTYLPKDLKPGLHKLEVSVYDRAGNSAHKSSSFFTQEIFAFADEPICSPNPATHSTTISFRLTQSADFLKLEIYNVAGELVYKAETKSQWSEFVWDCENQSGKSIASGVYVYLLKAKRGELEIFHKGKIAVVK